jgi:hypothetical protein
MPLNCVVTGLKDVSLFDTVSPHFACYFQDREKRTSSVGLSTFIKKRLGNVGLNSLKHRSKLNVCSFIASTSERNHVDCPAVKNGSKTNLEKEPRQM